MTADSAKYGKDWQIQRKRVQKQIVAGRGVCELCSWRSAAMTTGHYRGRRAALFTPDAASTEACSARPDAPRTTSGSPLATSRRLELREPW